MGVLFESNFLLTQNDFQAMKESANWVKSIDQIVDAREQDHKYEREALENKFKELRGKFQEDLNMSLALVNKFKDAMTVFESKIKADCIKNCKEWFGKSKMSSELVDNLMYPILKYPKLKDSDGNYTDEADYSRAPSLKVKLPYWEGRFNVELYNYADKTPLYIPPKRDEEATSSPVECIPKASHINGLIACQGMWFAGGRCGVTWKLVQACVRPPARLLGSATCHIEDDSDDEETPQPTIHKEDDDTSETVSHQPSFQESEEEEEEEEEARRN
jgi:hypothetical protein